LGCGADDLPEAFRDDNEDGTFDLGAEEFRDINNNFTHDGGNGIYNGTLCTDAAQASGVCSKSPGGGTEQPGPGNVRKHSGHRFLPSAVDLNVNTGQNVLITVSDINGNSAPGGSTVSAETTNGVLVGTSSFTIQSTTEPSSFAVFVGREETPNRLTGGFLVISVTTPKGIITTASIPVTDGG